MPLKSFRVGNVKAVNLAECTDVPPVMVIAGPNGVGKSTLLYQISQKAGTTQTPEAKFIYQPPHRAIRRTSVRRRFLMGSNQSTFGDQLSRASIEGYEGLAIPFPSRSPDNVDEAGSTIKYAIGRLENRRQTAFATLVDNASLKKGQIDTATLPDIYGPLRELTKYLLPHLAFSRIDFQNEDDIKCLWRRTDGNQSLELDIDDLSSGEKSIIILFLPLLEAEINRRLRLITGEAAAETPLDLVFIIDEPELHLHPDLQAKILTYIRASAADGIQFILSTHSPTLLDQTYDEELFVFRPASEDKQANQLQRIASSIERLEALKQLTGNTFVVTTGRSIVCVEGDADTRVQPADIRLLGVLYPRASAYTIVPSGGKGNVINTVTKLREFLPESNFGIKVFGVVDGDQATTSLPNGVLSLPVSMIENFLLDPDALLAHLLAQGVSTFADAGAVEAELMEIARGQRSEEVGLRVSRALKAHTVRLSGNDVGAVKSRHAAELKAVECMLPDDARLGTIVADAEAEVQRIVEAGTMLRHFRGKPILRGFFARHLGAKNVPYARFCYEVAQTVAAKRGAEAMLNPLFDALN